MVFRLAKSLLKFNKILKKDLMIALLLVMKQLLEMMIVLPVIIHKLVTMIMLQLIAILLINHKHKKMVIVILLKTHRLKRVTIVHLLVLRQKLFLQVMIQAPLIQQKAKRNNQNLLL